MAFKMNYTGFSPIRSNTPLHQQNVSTNEKYSVDSSGNRIKTTTTTTPEQIIKGTPAPEPVVTETPSKKSTFDPKGVTYADDCRGIKTGPGRTGTFDCTPAAPSPNPPPTSTITPPSSSETTGLGTPDQIIPGTTNVATEVVKRPSIGPAPSTGVKGNIEGIHQRSGIGSISIPIPELDLNLGKIELPSFRGIRNLIKGCKGGGCPDY